MKLWWIIFKIILALCFVLGLAVFVKVCITGSADPFSAGAMYLVNALWSGFLFFALKKEVAE